MMLRAFRFVEYLLSAFAHAELSRRYANIPGYILHEAKRCPWLHFRTISRRQDPPDSFEALVACNDPADAYDTREQN
jgi:hypothetical protein